MEGFATEGFDYTFVLETEFGFSHISLDVWLNIPTYANLSLGEEVENVVENLDRWTVECAHIHFLAALLEAQD